MRSSLPFPVVAAKKRFSKVSFQCIVPPNKEKPKMTKIEQTFALYNEVLNAECSHIEIAEAV